MGPGMRFAKTSEHNPQLDCPALRLRMAKCTEAKLYLATYTKTP